MNQFFHLLQDDIRAARLKALDEAIQICNEAIEDTEQTLNRFNEGYSGDYLFGCLEETKRLREAILKLKEK